MTAIFLMAHVHRYPTAAAAAWYHRRDARKILELEFRGGVCDKNRGNVDLGKGFDEILAAAAEEEDACGFTCAHALHGAAHLVIRGTPI